MSETPPLNTLVLVHRRQLQQQWIERLSTFLGMPVRVIGRIGGGRNKPTGLPDVGVTQSLVRNGVVDDLVGNYGHLITRPMATASTSSSMPSCFRKLSKVDPLWSVLF